MPPAHVGDASTAVKNSFLVLLLLLIVHVLLKNAAAQAHAHAQAQAHAGYHRTATYRPERFAQQAVNPGSARDPPARGSELAGAGGGAGGGAPEGHANDALLDAYVFGEEAASSAPAPTPTPPAAAPLPVPAPVPVPAAGPAAGGGGPGRRAMDVRPEDQRCTANMVVGKYENESTLCGGSLFEGAAGLQGFDGFATGTSAFQALPAA